jgi:hypothetical protein
VGPKPGKQINGLAAKISAEKSLLLQTAVFIGTTAQSNIFRRNFLPRAGWPGFAGYATLPGCSLLKP